MGISTTNALEFGATKDVKIYGSINGSREWPNSWRSSKLNLKGFSYVIVDNGIVVKTDRSEATIP